MSFDKLHLLVSFWLFSIMFLLVNNFWNSHNFAETWMKSLYGSFDGYSVVYFKMSFTFLMSPLLEVKGIKKLKKSS